MRIGRSPRLGKMGREALGPRIGKCHKENMSYFNKDWEGAQIGENGPGGLAALNDFSKDLEKPLIVETGRPRAPELTQRIYPKHTLKSFFAEGREPPQRGVEVTLAVKTTLHFQTTFQANGRRGTSIICENVDSRQCFFRFWIDVRSGMKGNSTNSYCCWGGLSARQDSTSTE